MLGAGEGGDGPPPLPESISISERTPPEDTHTHSAGGLQGGMMQMWAFIR